MKPPVTSEVVEERQRQDAKWGQQDHPDAGSRHSKWVAQANAQVARKLCQDDFRDGDPSWEIILLEEVYEAIEQCNEDTAKLREELIQVAAVCVAWAEAIDRRG